MEEQNVVFKRKKRPNHVARIAIAFLLCFLGYTSFNFFLPIFYDWQRINDVARLQQLLDKYYKTYRSYPEFSGILNGKDGLNQDLRQKGLFSGSFGDPRGKNNEKSNLQYYYSSNGSSYLMNFCLETNWFKGGNKGCNNQVIFSQ